MRENQRLDPVRKLTVLGPVILVLAAPARAEEELSIADLKRGERVSERALDFLSAQQQSDGSFAAPVQGQPGITSLCVLAFASAGHVPNEEPYGPQLSRAVQFMLASQNRDGLFSTKPPERSYQPRQTSHCCAYSHAITSFVLAELYGMTKVSHQSEAAASIEKALRYTRRRLPQPKGQAADRGAWRYLHRKPGEPDADMSVTSWQLLFLRSAKNAVGSQCAEPTIADCTAMTSRSIGADRLRFVDRIGRFHFSRPQPADGIASTSSDDIRKQNHSHDMSERTCRSASYRKNR